MKALKYLSSLLILTLTSCAPPNPPMGFNQPLPNLPAHKSEQTKQDMQTSESEVTTANKQDMTKLETTQASSAQVAQATNPPPSSWELSGAMAARGKSKSWTASVNWLQRGPGAYQIRLFGPLGSGTVLIEKRGGIISFRDGPKTATSSNADQLLMQQTGIRLPVNNLYYWVRGLPAPGAVQSVQRDSTNHIRELRQGGYTIQYLGYNTIGKTALPSHIRLQGNGVFINLVVKRWRI